jgi:hypothetical protein
MNNKQINYTENQQPCIFDSLSGFKIAAGNSFSTFASDFVIKEKGK